MLCNQDTNKKDIAGQSYRWECHNSLECGAMKKCQGRLCVCMGRYSIIFFSVIWNLKSKRASEGTYLLVLWLIFFDLEGKKGENNLFWARPEQGKMQLDFLFEKEKVDQRIGIILNWPKLWENSEIKLWFFLRSIEFLWSVSYQSFVIQEVHVSRKIFNIHNIQFTHLSFHIRALQTLKQW